MKYKPKNVRVDRCPKCGSDQLIVVRDSTWPHLECDKCGAYVRDFGD